MQISFVTGIAAALLAISLPLSPAHANDEPAFGDAEMTAASELAQLLYESNQPELQIERALTSITEQAFATDPALAALNLEYPGADMLFKVIMRPIMREELARIKPAYNAEIAGFFARNFTVTEIGELTSFWGSPAGQTLLRSVSGSIDFSSMSKEVAEQIDTPDDTIRISDEAMNADVQRAVKASARKLSSEHHVAVIRFGLTPTGRKLAELVPEKNEIERRWANLPPSAEMTARMDRELPDALRAFMAAEDRKRAEAQ